MNYFQGKHNFIVIEGNIGAGKTTLATRIAKQYNAKLILEQFADNPFLPKFYEDPLRYSFPLELSFLAERYQQLKEELAKQDLFRSFTISDYLFNKSLIFAKTNLLQDEFALFLKLFNIIISLLPKPDLLVYLYLDIDRLKTNIQSRGRDYEQNIKKEYLNNIQSGYLEFIRQQKDMRILIIDINGVDFVNDNKSYESIIEVMNRDYEVGINRAIISSSGEKELTL
ncbi:MAG: deoxynucleoside kinase [Bacteroidota bacterium]